ncbi:MAG: hypothetical protein IJS32_04215 [Kiritimatiellae bacterium]|nr:hypothetical protein [Kiritimatiellia bacterium]
MKKLHAFAGLILLSVAIGAALPAGAVPHVSETLSLAKGWNAVYLESTPDDPSCEAFFRDTPVIGAAAYQGDAFAATAQYDASGQEIVQTPIAYLQWVRGESVSTLQSVVGGSTLLLYATNAADITFLGVPSAPKMIWHKVSSSETNEFLNLAGVSSTGATVSVDAYFGEGPFGEVKSGRAIYAIAGEDEEEGPELKDAGKGAFGRPAAIAGGKAYALTAKSAGEWPGVVGVQGSSVAFAAGGNYASIKVKNCGTTNHVFRFSMDLSASGETPPPISRRLPRVDAISMPEWTNVAVSAAWTVSLAPGEVTEQIFSLDRSQLVAGTEYGAILSIEDTGASQMRVRLPVTVAADPEDAVAYPTGLWVGEIALSQVSGIEDATPTPVAAGGVLRMSVLLHVDELGRCKLLQRVTAGIDTNGTARLFRESGDVPAEVENAKRFSAVLMSVDTPVVEAASGSAFGDDLDFSWTVAATARDNPFRHAWHPDHDGKTADYSDDLPTGDDFTRYANPVKPELWSISNRLDFSWHEQGNRLQPTHFPYNADETTSGVVTWEVEGLIAKGPIKSVGTFNLQRVFNAKEIE